MSFQELYTAAVQDANSGQFAEAIRKLELILTHEVSAGDKANVGALLGGVYLMVGEHEHGTRRLEEALAVAPNNPTGWLNLSEGLRRLGRLNEAVEASRKALTLKPDFAEAYNNMGNALKDLGNRRCDRIFRPGCRRMPYPDRKDEILDCHGSNTCLYVLALPKNKSDQNSHQCIGKYLDPVIAAGCSPPEPSPAIGTRRDGGSDSLALALRPHYRAR